MGCYNGENDNAETIKESYIKIAAHDVEGESFWIEANAEKQTSREKYLRGRVVILSGCSWC